MGGCCSEKSYKEQSSWVFLICWIESELLNWVLLLVLLEERIFLRNVQNLVVKLEGGGFYIINGVLRTAHSIFRRYRSYLYLIILQSSSLRCLMVQWLWHRPMHRILLLWKSFSVLWFGFASFLWKRVNFFMKKSYKLWMFVLKID